MDSCKLFIGGISWETSEDCLREYFESYGEVVEAVIMKDRITGRARGFGFVVFADTIVAERVLVHKHIIDGKSVEAKKAVPRDDYMVMNKGSPPGGAKSKKIFVGGLASSVTEAEFKKYFAQFGTIVDVVVMYDHRTQRPRGFGFITYESEEAVDRVLQRTFHELDGKMVEVKVAVPKENSSPNRSFGNMRMMSTSLLNDYSQLTSPVSGYGGKAEGSRYSPNRGSFFSPFEHGFGIELNFEGNQNQSYVNGRPFSPAGYTSAGIPFSRYGTRNQLWGNNVGYIGEKWGTVGERRNNKTEFGIGYGSRSNGLGIIESRGGVDTSSLGWGMLSGEGVMRGFGGYMNKTEELLFA